ncbi:MAG TPA: hypothetical protein VFB66_24430 [Tepidisphaeraceae bacterium]|nr:hypothetical protein [Tepidisphaeraceae bacterium]
MRPLSRLAALFFAAFGVVHLLRVIQGWEAVVGGTAIPMWVSYLAIAVCALLALGVWREAGKKPSD